MAGRRKKRREDEEVSYWLSYSDMMAGLLLMFVIIISFTMMQSRLQYEEDARQLKAQQETLESQATRMETQEETLAEQEATLAEQEATLAEQEATLKEQEKTLTTQQTALLSQQKELEEQKTKLSSAQTQLETQQTTLESQKKQLEEQQKAAAVQQKALEEKQSTVDAQSEQLISQQQLLDAQAAQLSSQQKQMEEQQAALLAQTQQLEEQQGQIESQQVQMQELIGIRAELVEALRQAFEGTATVSVDAKTGAIMFDSNVLFDFIESELRPEGEEFLQEFLPQYFDVLLSPEFRDYVSEVIIEGHTDTDGDYLTNLEISQQRALAVARYCLEDEGGVIDPGVVETLRDIVTANGRSYSNPIYNEDGTINMDASRRVEVKFRLKDEEMVEQMIEILNS